MRKFFLILVTAFFFSVSFVSATNDFVYYIAQDVNGVDNLYLYNPLTNQATILYTGNSNVYLEDIAVDSKGNYYLTGYQPNSPYNTFIVKNGQFLLSASGLSGVYLGGVYTDINDNFYYGQATSNGVSSIYLWTPGSPILLYAAPRDYEIGDFAISSQGNIYAPVLNEWNWHVWLPISAFVKDGRFLFYMSIPNEFCEGDTTSNIKDEVYYGCSHYNDTTRRDVQREYKYDPATNTNTIVYESSGPNYIGGFTTDSQGNIYTTERVDTPPYAGYLKKNGQPLVPIYFGGSVEVAKQVPVVLVHGIYSNDAIWNQVENVLKNPPYNKDVYRVGQLLGQQGLVPNNGNIITLAHQLELATANLGAGKIDVVAHSMGGLVTRQYISSNRYKNNIRKLVMLGTPNEGAPIARNFYGGLWGAIGGQDPSDMARLQMIPGSPFLTGLNSNFYSYRATMDSIAGMRLNPIVLLPPIFQLSYTPVIGPDAPTDSIVPVWSVNIPNSNCYETDVVHATGLGAFLWNSHYTDPQTITATASLLNGNSTSLPFCRRTLDGLPQGTNLQTLQFNNTLNPNQQQIILQNTPLGTMFTGVIRWDRAAGNLSLEFVSPSNTIINAGNYNQYPGTQYAYLIDQTNAFESFTFEQPEQGRWTVSVSGSGLTMPTTYNLQLLMQKDISLEVFTNQTIYTPQTPFVITARVSNATQPVLNANVIALITKPDNSQSSITLFDDGLHQDGAAQDGLYGNVYTATSLLGTYWIDITASQQNVFALSYSKAVFTELYTDLELQNTDIQFTPSQLTLGQNTTVQVQATVRNVGQKDSSNVTISFYDGDPGMGGLFLGNATIATLPVNGSAQRGISFQHISNSQPHQFIEGEANLSATINISVKEFGLQGHDVYVLVESNDLDSNITNNIAHRKVGFGPVPYVVALSLGNAPGIPLGDGRVIPLNYDGIFEISLFYSLALGLNNSQGVLNDEGEAIVTWTIPNYPILVGIPFYVDFIVLDPNKPFPQLIYSFSSENQIVIQP